MPRRGRTFLRNFVTASRVRALALGTWALANAFVPIRVTYSTGDKKRPRICNQRQIARRATEQKGGTQKDGCRWRAPGSRPNGPDYTNKGRNRDDVALLYHFVSTTRAKKKNQESGSALSLSICIFNAISSIALKVPGEGACVSPCHGIQPRAYYI